MLAGWETQGWSQELIQGLTRDALAGQPAIRVLGKSKGLSGTVGQFEGLCSDIINNHNDNKIMMCYNW